MDLFVEQLADVVSRARHAREVGVRPVARASADTLGERIALGGTNWLNLRFVTPLDIALRMGAPFLVERGIDPSEEGLGPALMMRLLLDLPLEGGYFRPLADQPTMAQALWTTMRELRMAGVKSDDLEADAFESPAKHAELRALLASYEQFLAAEQPRRHGARLRRGGASIRTGARFSRRTAGPSCPTSIWTPLQRRLIDAMPGERIVPRALEHSRRKRCRDA